MTVSCVCIQTVDEMAQAMARALILFSRVASSSSRRVLDQYMHVQKCVLDTSYVKQFAIQLPAATLRLLVLHEILQLAPRLFECIYRLDLESQIPHKTVN